MKQLFKTYGHLTFIDGSYCLNDDDFPVILFVVSDHNRESRIVGFSIVACERQIIMDVVLDHFKQFNDTSTIKIAMIDKDLKEESAITKAFPDAKIVYCFWHVEKCFARKKKRTVWSCKRLCSKNDYKR